MSMSAGGNDGLFRLAETAAPEEGRIMPTERTYLKSSKTVSLNDAIALMKQRKTDPAKKIAGGLDDNSENVRKPKKSKIPPARTTSDTTPAADVHAGTTETHAEERTSSPSSPSRSNDPTTAADAHLPVENPADYANYAKIPLSASAKGRVSTADLMSGITILQHQIDQVLRNTRTLQERADDHGQSNNTASEKTEDAQRLAQFKAGRHKVTFLINSMEFSVKCLNMVKDETAHCLVLAFADDADSFFVPPMQSELKIKFDGLEEPGRLFYFGMCFRVRELGLKFLGFLLDAQRDDSATNT